MSEELLIAQQEVYRLKDRLGMLSALHKGCSGIQAENARLREQADALAVALEHACSGQLSKVEWARVVDEADAALRAFREATP